MIDMFKRTDSERPVFAATDDISSPERIDTPITAARSHSSAAVIGPSIHVRGDVSGDEDVIIHGKLEGTVSFPKNNITVGADGRVKADLKALKITVEGQVSGDLHGGERVTVKHTGRVEGNIVAPRVVLEDGCQFKGSVEMNFDASKPLSQDADKVLVTRKNPVRPPADKPDAVSRVSGGVS